jgi:hypothetical protein
MAEDPPPPIAAYMSKFDNSIRGLTAAAWRRSLLLRKSRTTSATNGVGAVTFVVVSVRRLWYLTELILVRISHHSGIVVGHAGTVRRQIRIIIMCCKESTVNWMVVANTIGCEHD